MSDFQPIPSRHLFVQRQQLEHSTIGILERSEDVLHVCQTPCVRLIYVLFQEVYITGVNFLHVRA